MRTAREVIAEAILSHPEGLFDWVGVDELQRLMSESVADAAMAALRAEGMVIVAEYDLRHVLNRRFITKEVGDRLDAALAAGGTDGH